MSKAHAVGEDGLTSGAPGSLRSNFLSGAWPSLFTSIIKYICLFAECSLGTDCPVLFLRSAFPGALYAGFHGLSRGLACHVSFQCPRWGQPERAARRGCAPAEAPPRQRRGLTAACAVVAWLQSSCTRAQRQHPQGSPSSGRRGSGTGRGWPGHSVVLPGSLVTWLRSPLQLLVSAAESSRGEATRRLCTHLLVGDGVEGPLPERGSGCGECGRNADGAQDVWALEESGSHPSSDAPAPEARCGAHASVTVQGVMDAGGPRRKHRPVAMLAVSSPPSGWLQLWSSFRGCCACLHR